MAKTFYEQLKALVLEVIESCPDGAPSGSIYAALLGVVPLGEYQAMIDELKLAGLVTERAHLLQAVR